jgi:zinc and cadmium transporter
VDRRTLYVAVAVVIEGMAGLAGGLLPERFVSRHAAALVEFAAGALLAAVFLDVLPEALASLGPAALRWTFLSFVLFALLEWGLGHHHPEGAGTPRATLPSMLLAADALHNIGDGAAIAAAFLADPRTGLVTAVAVIAHEVPQEIGDYALLRASGYTQARALLLLAAVQFTALLGALAVFVGAAFVGQLNGLVLSLASGTFLYIGATDLLPTFHRGRNAAERRERLLGFLAGIALIVAAGVL